jgi:hypothetical protein
MEEEGLPPGYHWMVTSPAAGRRYLERIATPSYRDSVKAFLDLNIQRIRLLEDQDHFSIKLELTFHNSPWTSTGLRPSTLTTPEARSWMRLGDVRKAFQRQPHLPQPQARDLRAIIRQLPDRWRTAVCEPQDPDVRWQCLTTPNAPLTLLEGPDPMDQPTRANPGPPPRRLWILFPNSGRLSPIQMRKPLQEIQR